LAHLNKRISRAFKKGNTSAYRREDGVFSQFILIQTALEKNNQNKKLQVSVFGGKQKQM
jgi:hypothetical protein